MKQIFTQKFFFYSFLGILTLQSTSIFASNNTTLLANYIEDIGCTDPCAPNYDPTAIDDDGSCLPYDTSCNNDCTMGEVQAWNPSNCSCVPTSIVDGCTIETACNYNPLANCNDDSCEFGDIFCSEPCNAIQGCTDTEACNFDANANCDDGSCLFQEGCTDMTACNFDASADCDDGSCAYIVEASAGLDQNVCGFTGTLDATSSGPGIWSSNFGGVSFADPSDPKTEVSVLQEGSYIFFWTVNEDCTDGTTPTSYPVTIFFIETGPADAGEDVIICNDQYELGAIMPNGLLAGGAWSVVSGAGIFGNSTDPTTTVTALADGVNILEWTVSSPLCPDGISDQIVITVSDDDIVPYAGENDTICGLSYNLNAQDDLGQWVGSGVFDDPINPNTTVTVDSLGTYPFVWTLSGFCGGGTDTVYITFKDDNLQAEAGTIQNVCGLTTNLNAMLGPGNTGMWVSNFGGVDFEEPTVPNSSVTVSQIGTYVFFWTEMATCGLETMSMTDQVIIVFGEHDMPETGDDITTCENTVELSANTPDPGNSGSWNIVQGYGEFDDETDPNTTVSNLSEGVNIFEWTIVTTNCGVNSEPLTVDVGISGCLDASACNYNAAATCMIECDYESCLVGCTDPCATNYDPAVLEDDGSCVPYDTVCDDGCALTTDLYDFNICECTNIVNTTLDDGCAVTNDYLDTDNCVVVHEPINLDDGCPLTTDIFDADNCLIINESPSVDDGCDLTVDSFNASNCEIINFPVIIDDGCPSTIESFDTATCTIITTFPNVDDGCDLTNDYFDVETCLIVNENPDVNDGCDLTFDSFNTSSCEITHIPVIPDDGCAATVETLDFATCTIISTPPNCDDLNSNTTDFFDFDNCLCINENIGCGDVICDDGCPLTVDSINEACECVFTAPNVNDGCPLTVDSFDAANCTIVNQTPNVDDGCPLTVDSFDAINCVVVNQTPNVDDGCDITTDSFDALTCTIVNTPVITDDGCAATIEVFDVATCMIVSTPPSCDDLDSNTTDFFDVDNCLCVNEAIGCGDLICDDGCPLTVDSINEATCECVFTAPNVDDGCPLTVDSFNAVTCTIVNETPNVDDGCDLTIDSFDALTCMIVNDPILTDDGCPLTTEIFNEATCSVIHNPPNCDDGDLTTIDFFDFDNCGCVNESMCGDIICDDGCDLTTDSLSQVTCECIFIAPDVEDDCLATNDYFDFDNCVIVNEDPVVDDGCDLTIDYFNPSTCEVVNEPVIADDGCDLTTAVFNEISCVIIHNPPNCDDLNINTIDYFDFENCACVNETIGCGDIVCDDGCDLTTDILNEETCQCEFTTPTVDDGCDATLDYFDALNCAVVNELMDIDDGCDITVDSFDALTCTILHEPIIPDDGCAETIEVFDIDDCVIVTVFPDCDDGNANTTDFFDVASCSCSNQIMCDDIICDDGCALTTDTLNELTCECVFVAPNVDDGCPLTVDSFNTVTCTIVNEMPTVDDGCDLTIDSFDASTCTVINDPVLADDGCPLTTEVFNEISCIIIHNPPSCDDGDLNTIDYFDFDNCTCVNETTGCGDIICDDGCPLTMDSLDEATCECVFTTPAVDDGCALTLDSFDALTCTIVNDPIITDDGCAATIEVFDAATCSIISNPPSCNDFDPNTIDSFDFANCICINESIGCGDIICDDGCDLTIDSLDEATCECVFTAPNVDDGCALTIDSFDALTCTIVNTPVITDDGCSNTIEVFDAATCSIISNPPSCNDFDPNTNDSFDFDNCMCLNEMVGPCGDAIVCDDGCGWTTDMLDPETCECVFIAPFVDDGCDLTIDSFDAANCMVIHEEPIVDDGCDLTIDFFNPETCTILNEPINVQIDDGCNLTNDYFDFDNCVVVNEAPNVDDGCDLTFDSFDALTCSINHLVNCDDSQDCTEDTFDPLSCNCVYTPLCATVTGFVFIDDNNNGINDAGDTYANNVVVTLFNVDGTIAAQTTTNLTGVYLFENVAAGDYYLHFEIPNIYTTIIPNVGNDNIDSDVGTDGTTASFTVNNGDFIEHISAGFVDINFDCEEFIADIIIDCKDDNYELVLSFIGAGPNGYVITNNLTGGQVTTTNENLVLSPFEFGTSFNYTVYLADNPSCTESFTQTIVDCALTAVELIDFSGMVVEDGNLLQWSTASEFNNDYFKLMRSTDGINFEEIHREDGAGNSSILHTYEFLDEDALVGITYYRLDQVDYDGKEISSDIVALERAESHVALDIYPNPSTNFINVQYISTDANMTQISVYNTQGQLVRFIEKESVAGSNIETISTTNFPTGLYFLEVHLDGHSIQKTKFIKR